MATKLAQSPDWPTLAVKDMKRARSFYETVLGYSKPMMESEEDVAYQGENGTGLVVYHSAENAGTNKATSASWIVKDLAETMADLKSNGVNFEEYHQPGLETDDGVVTWEEGDRSMKAAWFKDPDGNILNIMQVSEQ